MLTTHEHYFSKKFYLYSYVIDCHILADISEVYDQMWSQYFIKCFKENYERVNFIN